MKDINFHYWLQGSIELAKKDSFDQKDVEMVLKHISLVDNKSYFISWLEGFLVGNSAGVNKTKFKVLKGKLKKEFSNVSKEVDLSPLLFPQTPLDDIRRGPSRLIPEEGPRRSTVIC